MVRSVSRSAAFATALLLLAIPNSADAQHHGGGAHHTTVFVGGYFYDPFFGPYPWWPAYAYPYPYYPVYDASADLRLLVTPKEANVYVDGFFAGNVDDFDGFFQRLHVPPGAHEIVLYLQGYRTVHQKVYVSPASTYKLTYAMEKLGDGEVSEPPPAAPPVPEPPEGTASGPRTSPPDGRPPVAVTRPAAPATAPAADAYGSLVVRVQPGDATITIDGEPWQSSSNQDERLVVQVSDGPHHVVIQKTGYRSYSADVVVRRGETTPLNVSLSRE